MAMMSCWCSHSRDIGRKNQTYWLSIVTVSSISSRLRSGKRGRRICFKYSGTADSNGKLDYDGLQQIWRRTRGETRRLPKHTMLSLISTIPIDRFNRKQVFVVLTNGLDVDTREAIRYWKTTGLDIRPWVYRAYRIEHKLLLEIAPFRTADDPLEDQSEGTGSSYYLVNTNIRNDKADDADMLSGRKVAAYFEPWKYKIARIRRGDVVFLSVGQRRSRLRQGRWRLREGGLPWGLQTLRRGVV